MNSKLVIFIITLALLAAACSSDSEPKVTAKQTTAVATTVPATSTPTATLTPTPEPSPTATATPIPSPTPQLCDELLLQDAISALGLLDSYRIHVDMQMIDLASNMQVPVMSAQMATKFRGGEVDVMELVISYPAEFDQDIRMILAQGRLYLSDPNEGWIVLTGEVADAMLDRFEETQIIKPELLDNLAIEDCTVSDTRLRGEEVKQYSYSHVNFTGISTLQGLTLDDIDAEINSATLDVWLLSYEEIIIPVQLELAFELEQSGTRAKLKLSEQILDINVPFEIEVPDVEGQSFFLDLPLPEDAYILMENEFLLMFSTFAAPDDVLVLYDDYLVEDGWAEDDIYTTEQQGILFTAVEYSKAEQELTIAVGEQDFQTIVMIGRDEVP